jgi:hypothetical protein
MKVLVLFMLLMVSAQEQEYRHDKYKDDPHARCMRPEVVEMYGKAHPSMHACSCHQSCAYPGTADQYVLEDPKCELYCTKARCGCHADENICATEVPK